MTPPNQTDSGKALEYAVAVAMATTTETKLTENNPFSVAKGAYGKCSKEEQCAFDRAADEIAVFLTCHDRQFDHASSVVLQPDWRGKGGDVRDVVIRLDKQREIGISAKNNHEAVKHSRLSDLIDFGQEWADYPVSSNYFGRVRPIFRELRNLRENDGLFKDIANKGDTIYLPVLTAFEDEFKRLCMDYQGQFISRVFTYLLGTHDFYKVIKQDSDKTVSVWSMNMSGTLGWGRRWNIPTGIDSVQRKPGSNSTLLVTFTGGWQLSFRLHNAASKVEPSLKFDIKFTGTPPNVARHQISLV